MHVFWIQLAGLVLVLLIWLRSLYNLLTDFDIPPQFTLDTDTAPDPLPGHAPSLSVIIPARNEADNIEACVRSVLALDWPGPLEVVVLDDRSTDGTSQILDRLAAADRRLKVFVGADPPAGWLGKPHALHLAQQHATGDWLWFIDADVTLDPLGARRLLGRTIAQGAEMSSALGHLVVESFWERAVQTRVGALIAGGNPLVEVNDPLHERVLANGQCLLFKREAYQRLGGHEAIKGSVLDDVDFARLAKSNDVPFRLYFGPGVFKCRMYKTFAEIWQGWTKNLFPALSYSIGDTLFVTAVLAAVSLLPFVLLTKNLILFGLGQPVEMWFLGIEAVTVLLIFIVDAVGHKVRGYKWGLWWSFPIGMTVIIGLFWNSAWRITSGRGAVWKGRVVEAGRPKAPD
ncbi:MAG: glycosyltransferase [Myxococcales bacterium]|nr:glycosyltransferase [Myxococcales bacterium]